MTIVDVQAYPRLEHDAFVYGSDGEYLRTLVPLVSKAIAGGTAVLAVVPTDNAGLLAGSLGHDRAGVEYIDASDWYCQPTRTLDAYASRLGELRGRRVLVIGEVEFGVSQDDWTEWTRYESVLNDALGSCDVHVVCPYDRRRLPASVLDDAERTHPHLIEHGGRRPSARYEAPETLIPSLPSIVSRPHRAPDVELTLPPLSLREARGSFQRVAVSIGLNADRVSELTLALNEALTSAVAHRRGEATLRIWAEHAALACEVQVDGAGMDALGGFARPAPGAVSGYGLWLAWQLFDRADIKVSPGGAEVRLSATVGMIS